jgi:hypothetical protein
VKNDLVPGRNPVGRFFRPQTERVLLGLHRLG